MANNEDNFEEMYSSEQQSEGEVGRASKKATKKAGKALANQIGKAGKATARLGGTVGRRAILMLLPYIAVIVIIVLAIISLVAVLVFVFSGPDMLRGQIVQMADELWTKLKSALVGTIKGDDYGEVTDQHVIDVAKYIDAMGYDLVGYGFVKEDEKDSIKRNENDEIIDIDSDYITEYLAAENRTYMLSTVSISSLFRWWDGVKIFPENKVTGTLWDIQRSTNGAENSEFGTGMINISNKIDSVPTINIGGQNVEWDKISSGENDNGSGGQKDVNIEITPEIDRETRKLILKIKEVKTYNNGKKETKETKCTYNLEGYTGRYGKPIEFLLALHVGTMAPKFVEAIATRAEFDTKVNIRLYKSVEVVRLKYNNMLLDDVKTQLDSITKQIWNNMQAINSAQKRNIYSHSDAQKQAESSMGITYKEIEQGKLYEQQNTKEKYIPYIVNVENHWYKDVVFKKDLYTASSEDAYVETYPTTKTKRYNKFTAYTYISGELYQVKEPARGNINETFEKLFEETTWEKVDGNSGITNVKSKISLGEDMQNALVMLEKASQKSDDAKYIVRDLKEWLTLKGFKFKDTKILTNKVEEENSTGTSTSNSGSSSSTTSTTGSTTSDSGFKNLLGGKTAQIEYKGNNAVVKTSEIESGTTVNAIVSGTITQISDEEIQIEDANNNKIIITGIKIYAGIDAGETVNKNTPIGTTNSGKDITIKMQDESKNSISVKDTLNK